MTFPSIERVSYSTCSIYEQENEQVVARILEARPDFEVVKVRQSAATPIFFNYYLMKLYPNQHLFVPGRPGLHRPRLLLCVNFGRRVQLLAPDRPRLLRHYRRLVLLRPHLLFFRVWGCQLCLHNYSIALFYSYHMKAGLAAIGRGCSDTTAVWPFFGLRFFFMAVATLKVTSVAVPFSTNTVRRS